MNWINSSQHPGKGDASCIAVALLLAGLVACATNNPDELREKTAQATAKVRQDARAVAQGVREGFHRGQPLDLNSATRDELMGLPGITPTRADKMIAARPYDKAEDLVTRHILPPADFEKIKSQVTVRKP